MQLSELKQRPFLLHCRTLRQRIFLWMDRRPAAGLFLLSVIVSLIVECLSRRSLLQGAAYPFTNLLAFLCNTLIVMLTLSLSQLCPRKRFLQLLISLIWIGLGIANCVLLSYRTTPLAAIDFALLRSVWSIMSVYLTVFQMILIVLAFLLALAGLVLVWLRSAKHRVRLFRGVAVIAATGASLFLMTNLALTAEAVDDRFENLADAYGDYGFAYCFSCSVIDRGIDEPKDYSEARIDQILGALGGDSKAGHTLKPNIVFLQLESFFDVKSMEGVTFSEDPVPVFTELKEAWPSGYLTVPSIGAGTANTEFEVITGMCLDYFGTGEYPYKTILQDTACETVCYDLRELGYSSHAIHNHSGTFYDRHQVFANLGFDTFTSLEYMQNVETNPLGWAKDYLLTKEVLQALSSTEGCDFVYAISVQAHGKYPDEVIDPTQHITVSGLDESISQIGFEYFVSQIHETDAFVGALISALSNWDEPTILVLYGDHLPSFDLEQESVKHRDLFRTEYVLWNNFGMAAGDRDLQAYQLYAYVMDLLGFDNGVITKLHQRYANNPNYLEALELLEYDILYGEHEVYGGTCPYTPTQLQMGTEEIRISDVRVLGGSTYIYGSGFTRWSKAYIGGRPCSTLWLSPSTLLVSDRIPEPEETVSVAQVGDDGVPLSTTDVRTAFPEQ